MKATKHTISVEEAGRDYFGLCRAASFQAAREGRIPTIKIGKRIRRVPIRALEAMLDGAIPKVNPLVMRDEEWPGYG